MLLAGLVARSQWPFGWNLGEEVTLVKPTSQAIANCWELITNSQMASYQLPWLILVTMIFRLWCKFYSEESCQRLLGFPTNKLNSKTLAHYFVKPSLMPFCRRLECSYAHLNKYNLFRTKFSP